MESCLPSTLSWVLRYHLPEIAKIFRIRTMPRNRVQHQKGLSDDAFERLYPDEEACRKAWLAWRWPEGFKCPRCAAHSLLPDPRASTAAMPALPLPEFTDRRHPPS